MKFRASYLEIYRRVVKILSNDKDKMYINGDDNLYPNEIEGIINNSPTAFRCANLMAKYIEGKGIVDESGQLILYKNLPVINEKKNYKITDIISLASKSIAYQYGVFFHVIYGLDDNGNPVPKSLDVLNYCKARKSKDDDEEYPGKIIYKDFVEKEKFGKKVDTRKFYPFNRNIEIVKAQIKADAGDEDDIFEAIKSYKGQVYYLNLNPDQIYSSSLADSVYNDADTEYRIGVYANGQTRSGFLGKTVALTKGLDDEQSEQVKEQLADFMGADNAHSLLHLDVEQADSLDEIIKFIQLPPQFDDKLFEQTERRIRKNILGAFNNVPEILILSGDGALFGTNADAYKEAKIFYSEQNEPEREQLERALEFMGFPVKIEPIAKRVNQTENEVQ